MFLRNVATSLFLLFTLVILVCGIYPAALWCVGQTLFPFQANGSMLQDKDGKIVGSKLISQAFTKDEFFQPRPSAAAYDATASASSALAASNYALRDRIARTLGPIVKYTNGNLVAPDIEAWFKEDMYNGKPGIIAQWTQMHPTIAKDYKGGNIPATFFDMWRHDNLSAQLQNIPGDLVTTSASGLDPHITLQNALFQLPRIAAAIAAKLKKDPNEVSAEIQKILRHYAHAPLFGLAGEKIVNVLEVNLELQKLHFPI